MNRWIGPFAVMAAVAVAGPGCIGEGDGPVSSAVANLTTVPAGVSCIEVKAVGNRTSTQRFSVVVGQSTVLNLTGLPVGAVTFSSAAYASTCSALTAASVATWISDPVAASLTAGGSYTLTLVLRRNGRANVGVDFNDGPTADAGVAADVPMDVPTCPAPLTMCGAGCTDMAGDPANCGLCGRACAAGQACVAGACVTSCPGGQTACGATCATLPSDPANCGACGNVCAPGQSCVAGACALVCSPGQTNCAGSCRDLASDNTNCGTCGRVCFPGMACAGGACVTSCPGGQTVCGGVCASLNSDTNHCGACGNVCAAGQSCSGGVCTVTCGGGQAMCGGVCTSLANDPANCGGCGVVCASPHALSGCAGGACVLSACAAGFGDCDGSPANGCEASLNNNPASCGACGHVCSAANGTSVCAGGACALGSCFPGFANCNGSPVDGCETSLGSDNNNCGGCGVACGAGQLCSGGVCTVSCGAGQVNCGGTCASLANDPANCGSCGVACPTRVNATATCAAASCGVACNAGFADCNAVPFDGCETSLSGDINNCGLCGRACAPGQVCSSGACL